MTTAEYAEKIVDMIKARPAKMNPDKLLYEIYVRWKVAQGLRAVEEGRVYSHEQVREDMWRIIASKSSGAKPRKKTSTGSSAKSRKSLR